MSRPLIVNEFNSHTLEPSANTPALSIIMAEKKGRIKRSQLFSHSLAGRAGLLREIGASYDHGAVTRAWAENLGREGILSFPLRTNFYRSYLNGFASMVYEEKTRSIIATVERCHNGRDQSSMSYPPFSSSS